MDKILVHTSTCKKNELVTFLKADTHKKTNKRKHISFFFFVKKVSWYIGITHAMCHLKLLLPNLLKRLKEGETLMLLESESWSELVDPTSQRP